MISAERFVGRKAKPCGKCGGLGHYVNPFGGTSCVTCHPPKSSDAVRLDCVGGVWRIPATSNVPAFPPAGGGITERQAAYMAALVGIMTEPGGTLDRMDAGGHHFAFVSTSAQIAARMRAAKSEPRADVEGLAGEITDELTFGNRASSEVYPAGTPCEIFPGGSVPRNDPDSGAIIFSLESRKDARNFTAIRLAGRLRIVNCRLVRPTP